MAKKKTFQEYSQEALLEIEKTEQALEKAKLEKEQAEQKNGEDQYAFEEW